MSFILKLLCAYWVNWSLEPWHKPSLPSIAERLQYRKSSVPCCNVCGGAPSRRVAHGTLLECPELQDCSRSETDRHSSCCPHVIQGFCPLLTHAQAEGSDVVADLPCSRLKAVLIPLLQQDQSLGAAFGVEVVTELIAESVGTKSMAGEEELMKAMCWERE